MDEGFTLKEVVVYMGGAVMAAIGAAITWMQMFPMKRVSALEKVFLQHVQSNISDAKECELRDLKLRNHILENYPNNAVMDRVFDKLDQISEKIDNKQDRA